MELFIFILSVALYYAAFSWLFSVERRRITGAGSRYTPDLAKKAHKLKTAACSTDLKMRVDDLGIRNSRVTIIGYDASYFRKTNGAVLLETLHGLMKSNCTIRYVFVAEESGVFEDNLRFLAGKVQGLGHPVEVQVFNWQNADEETKKIAREMKTRHPTIIESDNGNVLWLEKNHPIDAMYAYGVQYVPPNDMEGEYKELYDDSKNKIELVVAKSDIINLDNLLKAEKVAA